MCGAALLLLLAGQDAYQEAMKTAWEHQSREDWAEAERAYTRALELRPRDLEAHRWRAVARFQRLDYEGERSDVEKIVEFHPKSAKAHAFRASFMEWRGDYGEALASFRRAAELDPQDRLPPEQLAKLHQEFEGTSGRPGKLSRNAWRWTVRPTCGRRPCWPATSCASSTLQSAHA